MNRITVWIMPLLTALITVLTGCGTPELADSNSTIPQQSAMSDTTSEQAVPLEGTRALAPNHVLKRSY